MSEPIDFDAAIRKNAALEMAHQRATTQAQAAELRAKDATIAELERKLDDISMEIEDACLKWIFEQSGPILAAKDATIAGLRAALESFVRVADDCADSENVGFMDKAIESARQALAASAPK